MLCYLCLFSSETNCIHVSYVPLPTDFVYIDCKMPCSCEAGLCRKPLVVQGRLQRVFGSPLGGARGTKSRFLFLIQISGVLACRKSVQIPSAPHDVKMTSVQRANFWTCFSTLPAVPLNENQNSFGYPWAPYSPTSMPNLKRFRA